MEGAAMTASADSRLISISIIVPIYNEEDVLEVFHQQLCHTVNQLPYQVNICYINDGSSDHTGEILQKVATQDQRVDYIELSRNFGHQSALTAGLDLAPGDVVITMDGDGQHPPELIPQMIELFNVGYDIVLTQRINDQHATLFKRQTSNVFYGLLNRLGDTKILPGTADYRLMSRQTVDALKQMREYHRFLRGMIPWMGYQVAVLPYTAPERLAGQSKYSFRKMVKLATDAIFSFSLVPLRIGISLGLFFFVLAGIEILYVLSFWFRGEQGILAPGWSSLMFMMLVIGGIQMIVMGFIGVYVGYIFQETKHRPTYLVKSLHVKRTDLS
jgi:polyisoprenyl-phosphate glycosyltransferase